MRVHGTIEDASTEKRLSGAMVTLSVEDTYLIENSPATSGYFDYEIPESAAPAADSILTCTVNKRGYHKQVATYSMVGDDIELAIELIPEAINWRKIIKLALIVLAILVILSGIGIGGYFLFFGPEPPPPAIASFKSSFPVIGTGGKTKIQWQTTDAKKVFLNDKQVKPSGSQTVEPGVNATYTLAIKDDEDNPIQKKINVTVLPPPKIVSFKADPIEINLWDSATLTWQTQNAESLYIKEGEEDTSATSQAVAAAKATSTAGAKPPVPKKTKPSKLPAPAAAPPTENLGIKKDLNGSWSVTPLETTKYTLVAVNQLGAKAKKEIQINVMAPPKILSFSVSNNVVSMGETVILTWETEGGQQVFLNEQQMGLNYSVEMSPNTTCTYTLVVRNKMGQRQETRIVKVLEPEEEKKAEEEKKKEPPPPPPKINRFLASSPVMAKGEQLTLSWVTQYATDVYLNGNRVEPLGSYQEILNSTTVFTLKAVNITKTVTWSRTIDVLPSHCTVILYELENFTGLKETITIDTNKLTTLNNAVSSIQIIGNCSIRVFSAPNFKATRQVINKSTPSLRGTWIGSNTISSIQIISEIQ